MVPKTEDAHTTISQLWSEMYASISFSQLSDLIDGW